MRNVMADQHTDAASSDTAWLGHPLALSPRAERLIGADFQPMLYLESGRRYIRLSRGAAGLLDSLDGVTSTEQILSRVSPGDDPAVQARRRRAVLHGSPILSMAILPARAAVRAQPP